MQSGTRWLSRVVGCALLAGVIVVAPFQAHALPASKMGKPVKNTVSTSAAAAECGALPFVSLCFQSLASVDIYVGTASDVAADANSFVLPASNKSVVCVPGAKTTPFFKAASGAANDVRCIPILQ